MIIHFGINPDSGGRPPIESRVTIIRLVMMGICFMYGIGIKLWLLSCGLIV